MVTVLKSYKKEKKIFMDSGRMYKKLCWLVSDYHSAQNPSFLMLFCWSWDSTNHASPLPFDSLLNSGDRITDHGFL